MLALGRVSRLQVCLTRTYTQPNFIGMPSGWNEQLADPPLQTPEEQERVKAARIRSRNIKYGLYGTYIVVMGIGGYFLMDSGPVIHKRVQTPDAQLSYTAFTSAKLVSSEETGPNTKLLTLQLPERRIPRDTTTNAQLFSSIYSVYIKDDDIQVERAYTPLEGINSEGKLKFWVKKYPRGEVGRWLHSKKLDDAIEIRAPLKTWQWEDGRWDEVVMISGGTGITPFYQLFHNVISKQETSKTKFRLLHASQTREDLPPPMILAPMKEYAQSHPEKFSMDLFVSDKVGKIDRVAVEKSLGVERRWWQRMFGGKQTDLVQPERRILFLVCGPEPMINSIAGPYGRNYSQGPVGGILRDIGASSSQVRKL